MSWRTFVHLNILSYTSFNVYVYEDQMTLSCGSSNIHSAIRLRCCMCLICKDTAFQFLSMCRRKADPRGRGKPRPLYLKWTCEHYTDSENNCKQLYGKNTRHFARLQMAGKKAKRAVLEAFLNVPFSPVTRAHLPGTRRNSLPPASDSLTGKVRLTQKRRYRRVPTLPVQLLPPRQ